MAHGPMLGFLTERAGIFFSADLLCCNGEKTVSSAISPLWLGSIGVMFMFMSVQKLIFT